MDLEIEYVKKVIDKSKNQGTSNKNKNKKSIKCSLVLKGEREVHSGTQRYTAVPW